jgi:hypothetical protein
VNAERHQRVMQLFKRALDRQGPDRASFLQTVCGADDTLREEVESLLAHHDSRTITPTRTIATDGRNTPTSAPISAMGKLVPLSWQPTRRDRLRAGLIALALALLLAAVGYWLHRSIQRSLQKNLADQLQATLESNIAAVTNWLQLQQQAVRGWAKHPELREDFTALVQLAQSSEISLDGLRASELHRGLLELLLPLLKSEEVRAINGTDHAGLLVFTSRDTLKERYRLTPQGTKVIAPVFLGQSIVLPPTIGRTLVENEIPGIVDKPMILVGSPVENSQGRVIGGLFATIESGQEFARLLTLGRAGEHGDNYAFGAKGQLLSLHPEDVRPPTERTLADVVAEAISSTNGIKMNLTGYKNHRGARVVGAAEWVDQYGFGVASEIEYDAAYAALNHVRRLFGSLFGLLVLASTIAFISSLSAIRLKREIGVARQLGQYTLEELIGEGGMGKVYRARHALLRRPTAVKVLDSHQAGAGAIARFEREVQLASSLTHPNTVEIYDYGRTDDGVFYYAMEYLPGITLDCLVKRYGPLGIARMLYLFRQILASVAEAHDLGLIHRDIKPSNIILCRRGGQWDFVKVVDFGLAKDLTFKLAPQITQVGLISGTPLYIAPECLEDPDNCSTKSDIYALGVVAFYLVTGRDLFLGDSSLEVLQNVSSDTPPRASDIVGAKVPRVLDDLIFQCVAKNPAERPGSVHEMLSVVDSLSVDYVWTQDNARTWWQEHNRPTTMSASYED